MAKAGRPAGEEKPLKDAQQPGVVKPSRPRGQDAQCKGGAQARTIAQEGWRRFRKCRSRREVSGGSGVVGEVGVVPSEAEEAPEVLTRAKWQLVVQLKNGLEGF